ncbi:P2 family phage major capsid protein [Thiofilum flexile]|uniref:P2 family phage major capsid protein n=1 Tax=Thiofilum flexile TaxID=125627 RepID=UPI000363EC1F|nr:P2 family phage major capsid protein [Thiofilum flexile]
MQELARTKFHNLINRIYQPLGLPVGSQYTLAVPRQQAFINSQIQEDAFLKLVNHPLVTAQTGDRLSMGDGKPVGSTTDTEQDDRKPRGVVVEGVEYFCNQVNFDTFIKYSQLDAWAHVPNFDDTYANYVLQNIAKSMTMIAFNGTHYAKTSNLAQYPLLQDCGLGWYAFTKKWKPSQILGLDPETGDSTANQYQLGAGGDYETLDALVFDLVSSRFDAWHAQASDLVVLVGRELWVQHGFGLMNALNNAPTEINALKTWLSDKTIAGYPALMPPYMPARGLMVTSLDNLSIYHQAGSLRHTMVDHAKRDRVEDYFSENLAFIIEDFGKFAAVRPDALLLKTKTGDWM